MLHEPNPNEPLPPLTAPAEEALPDLEAALPAPADDAPAVPEAAAAPAHADGREPEDEPDPDSGPEPEAEAEPEATAEPEPEPGQAAPAAVPDLAPAACAARLAELFPALFGSGRALPVKLRIQADIQQRAPGVFSRKALSHFLHRHTTGNAYLRALAQAAQRFDLDGNPAGELAEEHRAAAAVELDRRRAIVDMRRVAERDAARAAEAQRREQAADQVVEDAERRERAALLRAFEASTLAQVNFCALTGLSEEELEQQLAQARHEQAERRAPRADARPPGPAPDGRPPQGRRDALPPRRGRGRPPGPRQP